MNFKLIMRVIAYILTLEVLFMVPGFAISLYDGSMQATLGFLQSMVVILIAIVLLRKLSQDFPKGFYAKDGLITTALAWLVMSMFGCLPFYFSREIPSYVDCLFEMVSGFTTTGSSILPDVESISRGLLYWRSFSHWLGGMGILVFLLAIVPLSGKNEGYTLHILKAESPGPDVSKLVSRVKATTAILYGLYIGLTILNILFLIAGRMPLFDALCTAFGTAGTGGFGIKNDSMAGYSPYLQNVTTVFMILFGVNFNIYYLLWLKQWRSIFKNEELRTYALIVFGSIALITWNIAGYYSTLQETIRHAAFQVSSIITTTGFATFNFDAWPVFSKTILLLLMCVGACAGSTGGGIKVSRTILLFKSFHRSIHQALHPQSIEKIHVDHRVVDEKVINHVHAYLIAYVAIIMVSFLLISLDNFSIETNLSAVLATFNNIGPGFAIVGPTSNFSEFSHFSKLILIFDMLAGRLEILPVLAILARSAWK